VTGGAGYVGSVVVRRLIERGHTVRVVDCGFFGLDHVDSRAEVISGNILDFDRDWLDGIDGVVHLAGLSNDPMAAFSPSLNYLLNAGGAAIVAHTTKLAGIQRFVFGSTCSVYGLDDGEPLNEEHPTNPPFPYAISKLMAERQLGCLTDDTFRPIILRKGTVVGWSPRMRFDLVTNAMIKTALVEGTIVVHNPHLWRPLIDVEDAAEAYAVAVEADLEISGVFNISTRNFTLEELGEIVATGLKNVGIDVAIHTEHRTDVRSYRVVTDKAASVLKFQAKKPMSETVSEVVKKAMAQPVGELEHPRYYNIRQMQRLMDDGVLNGHGRTNGHPTELKHAIAASGSR
jgi:nucleoside-diphosphate-sugar epimerase